MARGRGARRAPRDGRTSRYLRWGGGVVIVAIIGVAWWLSAREAPAARLFREGRALQAQGNRAAAVGRYEQALAADPSRVDARFFLGQSLLADNRVSDAIPHLNAAVTAGVRPDVAPFDLARALASTGDQPAAQRALARLKIPPQADTGSVITAGRFAEDLGDAPLAIQFYAQASQRADVPSAIVERLAVLLATSNRTGEAIAVLERGIVRAPGEATLHLNLAVALAQEGRLAEARVRLREALRLRPDYPQAKALAERLGV